MTEAVQDNDSPWYYEIKGERKGPVSSNVITRLLNQNTLSFDSRIWQKGMTDWVPVSQTQFAKSVEVPPPLTGEAVKNTIVWWLAFAPLYGMWLELLVAGMVKTDSSNLWFITLGINIGLSYLDEIKLKKAGHNTDAMGGAWLIPVYLFKRAKILKQNKAYFIIWCFMFAIMLIADVAIWIASE